MTIGTPTYGQTTYGYQTYGGVSTGRVRARRSGITVPVFTVEISDLPGEEPSLVFDLNPRVEDVSITMTDQGGWIECSIGMAETEDGQPAAYLSEPVQVRELQHCRILAGQAVVFEGRIVELDMPFPPHVTGFVVSGYAIEGLADDFYLGGTDDPTHCSVILRDALAEAAPMLSYSAALSNCSHLLHPRSDFRWMTPGEIADALGREGGGGSAADDRVAVAVPWLTLVYEDRKVIWRARLAPDRPTYVCGIVPGQLRLKKSARDLYGSAAMVWTDADGIERLTPEIAVGRFETEYRFRRRKLLTGSSADITGATQFVRTWIEQNSRPKYQGTMTLKDWEGMPLANGGIRAPYLIRPGLDWVHIEGIGDNIIPISQVTFSSSTGETEITLGDVTPDSTEAYFRRLVETDNAVRTRRSPLTGVRDPLRRG